MNGQLPNFKPYKIAIVWRGDREARRAATTENNRFYRVFEELAALAIQAEPAVFDENFVDEVREQLLAVDGVLVWVDPLHQGETRTVLDALLRDVALRGPWVSAHPDVILKMGVKEVLHRTKHLGWGADTHLYRTAAEFAAAFPPRVQSAGPRVLKQNRGNGGQGVWKIELVSEPAGEGVSCASCTRSAGVCPKNCRWWSSWHAASPTSQTTDVSSINRFSRACPTA
jgi:hypothetical protein